MTGVRWGLETALLMLHLHVDGFAKAWTHVLRLNASPGLHFTGPPRDCENAHRLANHLVEEAAKCRHRLCPSPCDRTLALAKAVREVFGGGSDYGEAVAELSLRFRSLIQS